ncbi:12085_t:CDS:2, partial [Funneliformis geosporum]
KLESKKEELDEIKEKFDEKIEIINKVRAIELKIQNQIEDLERDEVQEFQIYTDDELDAMDKDTLQGEIDILKEKTENANPNLNILKEYNIYEKEYKLRQKDLKRLHLSVMNLKEMYQRIVFGGNAELECDNFDPFYDGVIFSVKPPKKSWRKISDLSGGEKFFGSSICSAPTPIYVMDEIDAALDFRNVSIVANYIKERIRDAQFIVISLHDNMSELADHLVGVFKTDDQSKSVTFNPRKFQELTLSKILGKDPLNKKLCV